MGSVEGHDHAVHLRARLQSLRSSLVSVSRIGREEEVTCCVSLDGNSGAWRPSSGTARPRPAAFTGQRDNPLPPLPTNGGQRNRLPGDVRRRLRLLTCSGEGGLRPGDRRATFLILSLLMLAGLPPAWTEEPPSRTDGGDDFGRWEHRPARCEVRQSRGPTGEGSVHRHPCSSLRMDQQSRGILVIRFVSDGSGSSSGSRAISFVGLLTAGSRPLRCHGGRCEPAGTLDLRLSAVAQSGFDGRGLATGLPSSHLATGSCSVRADRIHCQAVGWSGQRWGAEAGL